MANLTFKSIGATTVALNKVGSPTQISLKYSTNGTNWQNYTVGDQISLSNNQFVSFSGANEKFSLTNAHYYNFASTGEGTLTLSGDVMSLVSGTSIEYPYAFCKLFLGNEKIVDASNMTLSAENISKWCYANMFKDCTNLSAAPSTLPAYTLKQWCYEGMFAGCVNLRSAPSLPATTLAKYCYYTMFYNCFSLLSAPVLNNTELKAWCYNAMFYNCSSLIATPKLPATTLASGCYSSMFAGCSNITDGPELNAIYLVDNCYNHMFERCSKLSGLTVEFEEWTNNCTTNWVYGTSSNGVFNMPPDLLQTHSDNNIPSTWTTHTNIPFTMITNGDTAVTYNGNSDKMLYKIGNGTWNECPSGTTIPLTNNQYVRFKNFNSSSTHAYAWATSGTGIIGLSGQLYYLANKNNDASYYDMFSKVVNSIVRTGAQNIVNAYALEYPSSFNSNSRYAYMFHGCPNLSAGPKILPATTLTQSCYKSMFQNCYKLVYAPQLPATGLAQYCYRDMFDNCSSLVNAPELPATTLANYCYLFMFYGCKSMKVAPYLPATVTNIGCYNDMFADCSNLSSVTVNFRQWPSGSVAYFTDGWLSNVAANGKFTKPSSLSTVFGNNYIPSGWTVVNK